MYRWVLTEKNCFHKMLMIPMINAPSPIKVHSVLKLVSNHVFFFNSIKFNFLNLYYPGDKRANQHPALTALHIIFLRQHNRIVNELKYLNPYWDGETLYQEAKYVSIN